MKRTLSRRHYARRLGVRSTCRRATRLTLRTRWRTPDDLGAALTAFRRAVRAHRRLARLAPRFFDSALIERERREHESRCRWMALWEPALARVYGGEPKTPDPTPPLPPLPPSRTQRVVERELVSRAFWFNAGHVALENYRRRRPHALMNLGRLARLTELAFDLGRLATGFDGAPAAEPDNFDAAWADLERAYGNPRAPGSPSATVAQSSRLPPDAGPAQPEPAVPASPPSPLNHAPPAPLVEQPEPAHPRRDAWSRWARQMRRLSAAGFRQQV